MNRSTLFAAALLSSTLCIAQTASPDAALMVLGLTQHRGQTMIDKEIVPAFERKFAETCPPGGTRLTVDLDSFRGDDEAMSAFIASEVSDPSNRALGSLLHVLRNECDDDAGRAAVNTQLKEVRVRHERGLPAPQAALADGTLAITVDILQRKPPTVQQIEVELTKALN